MLLKLWFCPRYWDVFGDKRKCGFLPHFLREIFEVFLKKRKKPVELYFALNTHRSSGSLAIIR